MGFWGFGEQYVTATTLASVSIAPQNPKTPISVFSNVINYIKLMNKERDFKIRLREAV